MKRVFKWMANVHRTQRGFTLIELLIATTILGILASIAVPVTTQFIGSADAKAREIERDGVHERLEPIAAAQFAQDLKKARATEGVIKT